MPDLFADESFPAPAVRRLRTLGHDVLTAGEAGLVNKRIPDQIVLEYAKRLRRGVLTLNWRDFADLHAVDPQHAGVIVCAADPDSAALAARVHAALSAVASIDGQLIEVA